MAKRQGDVAVLQLVGEISAGKPARMLEECIVEGFEIGCKKFVLDMAGVYYLNSSGIGVMAKLFNEVVRREGDLCAINPQPQIAHVFQNMRAHPLFGRNVGVLLRKWGLVTDEETEDEEEEKPEEPARPSYF